MTKSSASASPAAPPPAEGRYRVFWTILVMAGVPLFYWRFTGQAWEDFLITFRASHNLAAGHGLTYEPGLRIYSFTSPINALLLAAFDWLTRTRDYTLPWALYNVAAIGAFVAGGLVLQRLMGDLESRPMAGAAWLWPLFLVLCVRTTAFVVNGQEAGFWVVFLALGLAATVRGLDRTWPSAGIAWCGLMWTRPDSVVHIFLLAAIALVWPARDRRSEMIGLLRAAGLCGLGYLPWFAGTWLYYGSPVPNSVQAKVGTYIAYGQPWSLAEKIGKMIDAMGGAFTPMYAAGTSGWGPGWRWSAAGLGLITATAWLIPGVSRLTRCASAACLGSIGYLAFVCSYGVAYPWYFIPSGLFGSLVCARLVFEWPFGSRLFSRMGRGAFGVGSLALVGFFFGYSLPYFANEQELVAHEVLQPIGLWLHDHVRPGDKVFLEPIGYIGYYSDASLYDYPGLATPKVVQLRRQGLKFYSLIQALQPAWLVLRGAELAEFEKYPALAKQYGIAIEIDNRRKIFETMGADGQQMMVNAHFFVLHRLQ
ncbi:MAG: hypothetical protein ABSE59_02100 [Opitutaceae bacterium]